MNHTHIQGMYERERKAKREQYKKVLKTLFYVALFFVALALSSRADTFALAIGITH